MGLDNVGVEIYDTHGYFLRLTVGQRTPGFWGVTIYTRRKYKKWEETLKIDEELPFLQYDR